MLSDGQFWYCILEILKNEKEKASSYFPSCLCSNWKGKSKSNIYILVTLLIHQQLIKCKCNVTCNPKIWLTVMSCGFVVGSNNNFIGKNKIKIKEQIRKTKTWWLLKDWPGALLALGDLGLLSFIKCNAPETDIFLYELSSFFFNCSNSNVQKSVQH